MKARKQCEDSAVLQLVWNICILDVHKLYSSYIRQKPARRRGLFLIWVRFRLLEIIEDS